MQVLKLPLCMAVLYALIVVMDVHMRTSMVVLMKCNELSACIGLTVVYWESHREK